MEHIGGLHVCGNVHGVRIFIAGSLTTALGQKEKRHILVGALREFGRV
jgi:hypothetical protein